MGRKRREVAEKGELDMTPMIDVTFLLLIFFMVITDLTQKDLAVLTLPIAYMAEEDKDNDEDDRIILNVDKHGGLLWKSKLRTLGEIKSILSDQKKLYVKKMARKGKSALEDIGSGRKASKLYVLLRADKDTPWQHVQWLMTVMAQEGFYKLQFATAKYISSGEGWNPGEEKALGGITQTEAQASGKGS